MGGSGKRRNKGRRRKETRDTSRGRVSGGSRQAQVVVFFFLGKDS